MPGELIDALRRCASLRHVMHELTSADFWDKRADQLMEVQYAVPHVRWHLETAPRDCFDETRQFCAEDYRAYETSDDDDDDDDGDDD